MNSSQSRMLDSNVAVNIFCVHGCIYVYAFAHIENLLDRAIRTLYFAAFNH